MRARCPPSMAVGTANVAFLDFSRDFRPRCVVAHQNVDVGALFRSMVELKHERVGLAAVDTRVFEEIEPSAPSDVDTHDDLVHAGPSPRPIRPSARGHALAVLLVPLFVIFALTSAAVRAWLPKLPILRSEILERPEFAAASADPALWRVVEAYIRGRPGSRMNVPRSESRSRIASPTAAASDHAV